MLVAVYVAMAALNYSVVQSYLGAAAGSHFSKEWGGEVSVGAMHIMPWNHLMLKDVRLVAPDGDTLLDVGSLRLRFKRFPYSDHHIDVDHLVLRDGYYHLAVERQDNGHHRVNLQYILDHYASGHHDSTKPSKPFTVDVRHMTVSHLRYKMELPEGSINAWREGVDIGHMDFRDINMRARNLHVVNDDVSVQLVKFSTTERSGMRVDHVEADVHVSPHDITVHGFRLLTPQSEVLADVEILWDGWGGHDYLADVEHRITLHPGTTVALADAAYWAPVLWGIDARIDAEGHVDGTIGDMHITDFMAHWGDGSALQLTGDVRGLPDVESTVFDVDIERLRTTAADLRRLGIVSTRGEQPPAHYARIDLPDLLLRQVDFVDLNLRLHGGMGELGTANLQLESGMGGLHADVVMRRTDGGGARFNAEVGSSGLGLKVLRTDWLSHTGFDLSLAGTMERLDDPATLCATLDGQLNGSVVRGQRLAAIDLGGSVDHGRGHVEMNSTDSAALFTAQADFDVAGGIKKLAAQIDARRIDTERLNLTAAEYSPLAARLDVRYEGTDIDSMQGEVRLYDATLGPRLAMSRLAMSIAARQGQKNILLQSDPMDATLAGKFSYYDLPLMAMKLAHSALPADLVRIDTLYADEQRRIADANLGFHINWHDSEGLAETFLPSLRIANGTRIDGSYNNTESLKLVVRSDSVAYNGLRLDGVGLVGRSAGGDLLLRAEAQEVHVGSMPLAQRVRLGTASNPGCAKVELEWQSDDYDSQGDLALQYSGGAVSVLRDGFTLGGNQWRLGIDSMTVMGGERMVLAGSGVSLRSERQSLVADVSLRGLPSDNVQLLLDNFSLQGIGDLLLQGSPLAIGGQVGGRFSLYGLADKPYFNANLTLDSCMVNQQPLGTMRLNSNWNAELNTVNISLLGNQLAADGWVELGGSSEVSMAVDFDSLNLTLLAPLLTGFSSHVEGMLHGSLDVGGTLRQPLVVGEAKIENSSLRIDATGVTYLLNDSIQFTNNLITLNHFLISDERGNKATVDGIIRYDSLPAVSLDLNLGTDRLMVLDKRSGDDFYGTLMASATGSVRGRLDSLLINISARTVPGCSLTVPVSDRRQVKAQNYITFVSDKPEAKTSTTTRKRQQLELDLDLGLTPDLLLSLPIDFSEATVGVTASGAGDLHLSMSGNGEPQVAGSYEITSGTMKVGLLSIISKNFTIEEGSNLQFQGSLPDARFDLSAVYSQRVNLSSLTGGVSDAGGSQKYLQVEDVINIAGTLQDPTIGFDIRLPGADASVEEEVFAYIDRSSERDMLTQAVSLLVSGHFYNANASTVNGGIATSGGIGALGSVVSDMVSVVDIDFDYKAGNEFTRDQIDVNISKDWGRWYLESTLGYGGESRELAASATNTAVIDALLGYRISPLVHLFAYNRTNTNDYTRMDLPYKQGVGLKLTKDFDRWVDLFKKKSQ